MTDPLALVQQPELAVVPLGSGRIFAIPPDITDLELAEMAAWAAAQAHARLKAKAPKLAIVSATGAPLA